jgi:sporulation protein YlmC with PRC-barrel domain
MGVSRDVCLSQQSHPYIIPKSICKEGKQVADYKFDGMRLVNRNGQKIAAFDGKYICDSRGSRVGVIDGKYLKDSSGTRLAEFDGSYIQDSSGNRIGTLDDVKKAIDGIGGLSLIGMWFFFVR